MEDILMVIKPHLYCHMLRCKLIVIEGTGEMNVVICHHRQMKNAAGLDPILSSTTLILHGIDLMKS